MGMDSVASRARGVRWVLLALILLIGMPALALAGPVEAARADVDDFEFESLDVEYVLGRDDEGKSTLTVVETFVAIFPEFDQNRGMRRSIPETYLGSPLHPHLVSITDENGDRREAEAESDDNGYYVMTSRAGDYVHGRQTYVFTYTLENVARHFDDTGVDEFYWNVVGAEWAQPFGSVTARVRFADGVGEARTGAQECYFGSTGATTRCPIGGEGAEVVAAAGPLRPYQAMTIAIAFESGTFTPFDPAYLASPWGWLQGGIAVLGLGGAVAVGATARRRSLRDAPGRPTIIAEYTPPRQVDALESAVLLGHTTKAIPAEVLEQAVVGSIRIEEGANRWFGGTKLKAVLVDPSRADRDGRMLLHGLFPTLRPGEEFEFGRTDTRFSTAAQSILKAANKELVARGLRREVSPSVRAVPVAVAILATVLVFLFGFAALEASVTAWVPILVIIASVLVVLVVAGLVSHKPLTAEGAEVRDHLKGLKVFIEWAEADRIRMLQSPQGAERVPVDVSDSRVMLKLYESLLPYAVVFGQEKEWAERLAVLYGDSSPSWYVGSSGFNAAAFSAGVSSLSAATSSSSSTSGGSSGGGSAGGGGGGGGGGGV